VAVSILILTVGLLMFRGIYLNSIPASVLPADAAAAAFGAFVHFLRNGLRVALVAGLVLATGPFFTGPLRAAIQTRSGITSGIDWIRNYGERRGVSTGLVGQWTYLDQRCRVLSRVLGDPAGARPGAASIVERFTDRRFRRGCRHAVRAAGRTHKIRF
jgi:hypothetical protein